MPLNLKEKKKELRDVEPFEVLGDPVHLTIRPHVFTPRMEKECDGEGGSELDIRRRFLERVVASWDIELEKGKLLPITFEGMQELPHTAIAQLVNGVVEAMRPPKPSDRPSGSFS